MTNLAGWQDFYVIVGSSAGALIGLQFVVTTLISDLPGGGRATQTGSAFSTPTIFHFGVLLMLFSGFHNAWDAVTYHVFHKKPMQEKPEPGR